MAIPGLFKENIWLIVTINQFGGITFAQLDEQWRLRDNTHGEKYSLTTKDHTDFELYPRPTSDSHIAPSFEWRLVASHLTALTDEMPMWHCRDLERHENRSSLKDNLPLQIMITMAWFLRLQ